MRGISKNKIFSFLWLPLVLSHGVSAKDKVPNAHIEVGAKRLDTLIPILKNKSVGLVVNHTSIIDGSHLLDTLLARGIQVYKVFTPEHGFRGTADASETVNNSLDQRTGTPIISLYGKRKKPYASDLSNLDIVVFDIQDVGVRFYTYISTMHYVMEACAENKKTFIVLDRPNPNGSYIDGPVREERLKSFLGMHPIPIVHGLTVGELAYMINGEGWLKNSLKCDLMVMKCRNWDHNDTYTLPIKPSPNLPNQNSIYLYPSLCLFENTIMSIGRGTDTPFQVIGHPLYNSNFSFTPTSRPGAKSPKHEGETCFGDTYSGETLSPYFDIKPLMKYYKYFKKTGIAFFGKYFMNIAGTYELQEQIEEGWTEQEIRESWQSELEAYKRIRSKYLLYEDF